MKALRFNPLQDTKFDEIESSLQVVDEFYISTNKGPLLAGIVWLDTPANWETIQKIIYQREAIKRFTKERELIIHKLMNEMEDEFYPVIQEKTGRVLAWFWHFVDAEYYVRNSISLTYVGAKRRITPQGN